MKNSVPFVLVVACLASTGCEELEKIQSAQCSPPPSLPELPMAMGGPAMALVDPGEATHVAVRSGAWADPCTWQDGRPPEDGARVLIPQGIHLRLANEVPQRLATIALHGHLTLSPRHNTRLMVDTFVSAMHGHLQIGTADEPVRPDVTAEIVFTDSGPIDTAADPSRIGRGAILMGPTSIWGQPVQHRAVLAAPAREGDTTITLTEAPQAWQVGDDIVIAGTITGDPESDERRAITGIQGNSIQLDRPLDLDHQAPAAGLEVHVAHLTRNVIFRSEATDISRRGHVMFMHNRMVDVNHAAFNRLGRTDKQTPLDDWYFPDLLAETAEAGPATNIRGRYAVHFHRGGVSPDIAPSRVHGSVVVNNPGWAYVNHSSSVDFTDNVSYDVVGGAFQTEAGDELGSFVGNIAIRTVNPAYPLLVDETAPVDIREDTQDFAFQGDGFWIHGGGVYLEDNIASGSSGHGFIYWTEGLREVGTDFDELNQFLVTNIPGGDLITDVPSINAWWVPLSGFRGNQTYASTHGLALYYVHSTLFEDIHDLSPAYLETVHSTLEDLTIWNVSQFGMHIHNSERIAFRNIRMVQDGGDETVGIVTVPTVGNRTIWEDIDVQGFDTGMVLPTQGDVTVQRGSWSNRVDFDIYPAEVDPKRVADNRDVRIRDIAYLPSDRFGTEVIHFNMRGREVLAGRSPRSNQEEVHRLFMTPDRIVVDVPEVGTRRLYFDEQSADTVPAPAHRIPDEAYGPYVRDIEGLTNEQLRQSLGMSFGGAVTPPDAETSPKIAGGVMSETDEPEMNVPACLFINAPMPEANTFDDFDFYQCWSQSGGIESTTAAFDHDLITW